LPGAQFIREIVLIISRELVRGRRGKPPFLFADHRLDGFRRDRGVAASRKGMTARPHSKRAAALSPDESERICGARATAEPSAVRTQICRSPWGCDYFFAALYG
jgi:hypothetical protein